MIVFLIDADNLNSAEWVEEAISKIEKAGRKIDVRRAYGSTANLGALTPVLIKRAIVPMHNIFLNKNTTDVALAVDAMWFSLQVPTPITIVIGSGDADFVPLAVKLRERGIRTVGISGPGKMSNEVVAWYDEVIYVGKESISPVVEVVSTHRAKTPPVAMSEIVAARTTQPKAVISGVVESPVQKVSPDKEEDEILSVQRILAEIPGWLPNTVKQLNQLGKPLREAGVKKGNRPLHDLFAKYPNYFKVLPTTGAAKQVRLLRKP